MCFLAVTLLSLIAHLTAGQGWGGSNTGASSGWSGASNSQTTNAGNGNSGWGAGTGAGFGTSGFGAGRGSGTTGFGAGGGVGSAGFGQGGIFGTPGFGAGGGVGTPGFGASGGVGTPGFGTGGIFGTPGFGASGGVGTPGFGSSGGFGTPGFGVIGGFGTSRFGGHGLGRAGFGFGRLNSFANPLANTTITCTFSNTGITGSVTLRRQQNWGGWGLGWGQRSSGNIGGSLVIRTSTVSGTFNLVFTERSRDGTKTSDSLGPVIGATQFGQSSGWGGHGLRNLWSNPWSNTFGNTASTNTQGIATTVTLSTNQESVVDLASARLPFRDLNLYGGRGLALCASLTSDTNGRTVCADPILACCTLGFDNQDAVTPAAP